jgi:hypothetical protein
MIDVKLPIKVKDLAKVVDQANVNPHIVENNKLIAEFMEFKFSKGEYYRPLYNSGDWIPEDELQFHESWDELMPVVDTINDYTNDKGYAVYSVEIDPNHVTIRRGLHTAIIVDRPQADSYMEMIYLAVVEFAKRFHQYGQSL